MESVLPATAGFLHQLWLALVCAVVVLAAAFVLQRAALWMRQPPVLGLMVAGVVLGPTMLAGLWPWWMQASGESGPTVLLHVAGATGLFLYMAGMGAAHDSGLRAPSRRGETAGDRTVRGGASGRVLLQGLVITAVPFGAGWWIGGWSIWGDQAGEPMQRAVCALALCVSAFPMLARILHETGIADTRAGRRAMQVGVINDALIWCGVAVVIGIASGAPMRQLCIMGAGLAAILCAATLMTRVLPPGAGAAGHPDRAHRNGSDAHGRGGLWSWRDLVLLGLGVAMAAISEGVGLYAALGGYLFGLWGRSRWDGLLDRVTAWADRWLLPFFFATAGLSTDFSVAFDAGWAPAVGLVLVAIVAKVAAGMLALSGDPEVKGSIWQISSYFSARGLIGLAVMGALASSLAMSEITHALLLVVCIGTTLTAHPLSLVPVWAARLRRRRPTAGIHSRPLPVPVNAAGGL